MLRWDSHFKIDLSRSCYTCFDAPWQEKLDRAKISFLTLLYEKLFSKKKNRKKSKQYDHFDLHDLWSLSHCHHFKSDEKNVTWALPGLSDAFCRSVLSSMVFEILMISWQNTLTFGKFDLWWPLVTSILIWEKQYQGSFERTLDELSSVFFSFFATMSGSRVSTRGFWSPPHDSEPLSARQEWD